MAKKRLNKKVAIIGSIILAVLILAVIVIFLRLGQNPEDFIRDAETALSLPEKDYEAATKAYGQAFKYAKNRELQIEIVFKLADLYEETNDWPKVTGCWNKIITIDTSNLRARRALLDYSYQAGDSGNWGAWRNVESNASELIDKQLDTGTDIYMYKSRAILELTKRGQTTDRQKSIAEVVDYLEKVRQLEPDNVDVYMYLAQAAQIKGQIYSSQGIPNAQEQAAEESREILRQGVENAPEQPEAHINYLNEKYRTVEPNEQTYEEFEAELVALTERFPDNGLIYFALAYLYQKDVRKIDKAIVAVEKTCELENENVNYALLAADLYSRRYSIYDDNADLYKAIDFAKEALTFPKSQDIPGPRSRENYINRFSLRSFLADRYIEQATLADATDKSKWIELSEKEVHEIAQLLGSGENPYAIMWKGRLALAKGQRGLAIPQLYTAYDQLVTAQRSASDSGFVPDKQLGQLAYTLARAYWRTNEIGAIAEFLGTAINNGIYYFEPDALLDYAAVSLIMKRWPAATNTIDFFEKYYPSTDRSKRLRLQAYIGARLFEQAEEELAKMTASDPNVVRMSYELNESKIVQTSYEIIRQERRTKETGVVDSSYEPLKAELKQFRTRQEELLYELLEAAPDLIGESLVVDMIKYYVSESKNKKAKKLIDKYLRNQPDSVSVKIYKEIIAEPDPANISQERFNQITESALNDIADPTQRNVILAKHYRDNGQVDKAVELYREAYETEPNDAFVISSLFDIALAEKDMEQIDELVAVAQKKNLDNCQGDYFAARAAMVREDYKRALEKLDSCLKQRPIFSTVYLLRSRVNSIIEKDDDAIEDMQRAFELNPLDGVVAKSRAFLLYQRNKKLGPNVSPAQTARAREALLNAMTLNKTDVQLQSFYAEYIGQTNPEDALAIRQQLQAIVPTVENSLLLGSKAYKMALEESDQSRKEALLEIAENAYIKAVEIDPTNEYLLGVYSEFLRRLGRQDEAKKLLAQNENVLWKFYIRDGQLEQAKEILIRLSQAQPDDASLARGMLAVAKKSADKEGIIEHSNRLLELENTEDNQFVQIQSFFEAGLVAEAEEKLKTFRKENPDNIASLFFEALLTAKKGQFEKALELTNQTLESWPNKANLWRLRGQINRGLNDFRQAISDFQKCKSLKDEPVVRADLARAYLKLERIDDAITELMVAIDQEQSPLGSRVILEQVYMKHNPDKLGTFYRETIEQFPDFGYWYGRAAELAISQQDYQGAFQLYEKAWDESLRKFGGDPAILDGIMRALVLNKKYEQLLSFASKFIDGPFASVVYSRMAEAKFKLDDSETAIQYYRKSLEKAGTNMRLIANMLSRASMTVGPEEALKWCNEKLQANPESLKFNTAIIQVYETSGEYNKAIKHLDKCIQIASKNNLSTHSYTIKKANLLQKLYTRTSDKTYLGQVIKEYESMLEKQPNNIVALNNLAYLLVDDSEEFDKALKYARRAYDALPNNPDIIDTYAYVLIKKGQSAKAEELLQMAVQLFEQDRVSAPAETYEHIGMAKKQLNQYPGALEAYEMALEIGKEQMPEETKQRLQTAISELSEKIQNGE